MMIKKTVTPLFLVGYMGSGKSTIGNLLSTRLSRPFFDTDTLLEKQEGVLCSTLIQSVGEAAFREKERAVLLSLLTQKAIIVATGGGLPCYRDNIELMNKVGCVIYLQWSVEPLAARLELTDLTKRPLLQGKTAQALRIHIAEQLNHRDLFYAQAQHTLCCNGLTEEEVLKKIITIIS